MHHIVVWSFHFNQVTRCYRAACKTKNRAKFVPRLMPKIWTAFRFRGFALTRWSRVMPLYPNGASPSNPQLYRLALDVLATNPSTFQYLRRSMITFTTQLVNYRECLHKINHSLSTSITLTQTDRQATGYLAVNSNDKWDERNDLMDTGLLVN